MYRFKCQYCGRVNKDVCCAGCGASGDYILTRNEIRWTPDIDSDWREDFYKVVYGPRSGPVLIPHIPDSLYISCLSL